MTAVQWLERRFHETNGQLIDIDFDKAKEMEKEQIMQAVYDSMGTNFDPNIGRAEMYYNEKYGK